MDSLSCKNKALAYIDGNLTKNLAPIYFQSRTIKIELRRESKAFMSFLLLWEEMMTDEGEKLLFVKNRQRYMI